MSGGSAWRSSEREKNHVRCALRRFCLQVCWNIRTGTNMDLSTIKGRFLMAARRLPPELRCQTIKIALPDAPPAIRAWGHDGDLRHGHAEYRPRGLVNRPNRAAGAPRAQWSSRSAIRMATSCQRRSRWNCWCKSPSNLQALLERPEADRRNLPQWLGVTGDCAH